MTPSRRALWSVLVLVALAWHGAASAIARQSTPEDPNPSFTATFGLGRVGKSGAWCPVRLEITGGAVPMDGVARISIGRGVQTDLTIEAPFAATPAKTTFVDFAVPIIASSPHSGQERWAQVTLISPQRDLLRVAQYSEWGGSQRIQMLGTLLDESQRTLLNVGRTTLRTGASDWAFQFERYQGWSQLMVNHELPESLPTLWIGYESTDGLVITQSAFDTLDSAQQNAIRDWIIAGGRVLFIAESQSVNLAWLPGGAPARLLISVENARPQWSLTESGNASGWRVLNLKSPSPDSDHGGVEAPAPSERTSADGVNAIAHGVVGTGWLTLLARDPGDIYPWGDKGELWREALAFTIDSEDTTSTPAYPWGQPGQGAQVRSMNSILNLVADAMDIRSKFPIALFAGVLVLLALAVGPIDRLVLKRLRLSGMAWLSALVWIGAVSTIAYFGPRMFRASSSIQSRVISTDINTLDGTAVRSGIAALFAGKSGERGLANATPDSWWRPVSTTRHDWNREPLSNVAIETSGHAGSRPDRMYMGVWTLNMLADDAVIDPPYSARIFRSDQTLTLEGLPADAEDVLVLWDGRSLGAHLQDNRWTLHPADAALPGKYGLAKGVRRAWMMPTVHHHLEITAAAMALPGPNRRLSSFLDATRSDGLAMVYFTRMPETPDVAFTLGGEQETRRQFTREVVRMLVRVPTETEP